MGPTGDKHDRVAGARLVSKPLRPDRHDDGSRIGSPKIDEWRQLPMTRSSWADERTDVFAGIPVSASGLRSNGIKSCSARHRRSSQTRPKKGRPRARAKVMYYHPDGNAFGIGSILPSTCPRQYSRLYCGRSRSSARTAQPRAAICRSAALRSTVWPGFSMARSKGFQVSPTTTP